MSDPAIAFQDVVKTMPAYNGNAPDTVLNHISFVVQRGEICILLGPSGCGKSTSLRLLASLDSADAGHITVLGKEIHAWNVREYRSRVAMVFQLPIFLDGTVEENLGYGLRLRGVADIDIAQRVQETLRLVGLQQDMLSRDPDTLSPGEQQRASIARAICGNPDILLLDEPTSALDPTAGKVILDLVGELREKLGLTIVLVTHNLEQARRIGDRGILLHQGHIAESGSIETLFTQPATEEMQQFLIGNLPGGRPAS